MTLYNLKPTTKNKGKTVNYVLKKPAVNLN